MEPVTIEDYRPEWQPRFEELNTRWIKKYFEIEDIDRYILQHPEEAILNDGGKILMALEGDQVIGTVALKKIDDHSVELEKLSVAENMQGRGAGRKLCVAAIEKAREMNAAKIILYSNSKLKPAIKIYEQLGFRYIPPEKESAYKRVNVKMELNLK